MPWSKETQPNLRLYVDETILFDIVNSLIVGQGWYKQLKKEIEKETLKISEGQSSYIAARLNSMLLSANR